MAISKGIGCIIILNHECLQLQTPFHLATPPPPNPNQTKRRSNKFDDFKRFYVIPLPRYPCNLNVITTRGVIAKSYNKIWMFRVSTRNRSVQRCFYLNLKLGYHLYVCAHMCEWEKKNHPRT